MAREWPRWGRWPRLKLPAGVENVIDLYAATGFVRALYGTAVPSRLRGLYGWRQRRP